MLLVIIKLNECGSLSMHHVKPIPFLFQKTGAIQTGEDDDKKKRNRRSVVKRNSGGIPYEYVKEKGRTLKVVQLVSDWSLIY